MSMRITIQVVCDTPDDAKDAINRLTRPKNWVDMTEAEGVAATPLYGKRPPNTESTGSSEAKPAEQSGSNNGATGAPRPNVSPGWTACQKIGTDTKELLLKELPGRVNDPAHIAKKIKRTEEQTKALIQLVWDRGLIKYDGQDFYE